METLFHVFMWLFCIYVGLFGIAKACEFGLKINQRNKHDFNRRLKK